MVCAHPVILHVESEKTINLAVWAVLFNLIVSSIAIGVYDWPRLSRALGRVRHSNASTVFLSWALSTHLCSHTITTSITGTILGILGIACTDAFTQ